MERIDDEALDIFCTITLKYRFYFSTTLRPAVVALGCRTVDGTLGSLGTVLKAWLQGYLIFSMLAVLHTASGSSQWKQYSAILIGAKYPNDLVRFRKVEST